MLNYLWLALVLLGVVLGGLTGHWQQVTDAAFDAAKSSVMDIALPLIGLTALWLGVMRLAEKAGMIQSLARGLRPLLRFLFPEVPLEHPAMGSMVMNIAANMLGLANAATPLGLRAMNDLEQLNPHPGTATNAMCTFLAINTSSVQLIPMTAISLMAAAGGRQPTAIVAPALLATLCSTAVGIIAVKSLARLHWFRILPGAETVASRTNHAPAADVVPCAPEPAPMPVWGWGLVIAFTVLCLAIGVKQVVQGGAAAGSLFVRSMNALSLVAVPFFLGLFPLYAALRRVRVYEEFVEGAKEGFAVAVRIIPYLVAMLVAVGVFRAAGGVDLLARWLGPVLGWIGFPVQLLPMAFTRPLSGSATIGLFGELVKSLGPDNLVTRMGGTLLGSTETTFYVLAVYFGAVGVQRTRHAVAAGLLADAAGMLAAVAICRLMFGG